MTMASAGVYTSNAGVEIQAVFNNVVFGDLHMIKYATARDVANIHVMGTVNSVGVAKGKRATTGACIFSLFQKDRLVEALKSQTIFLSNNEAIMYGVKGVTQPGAQTFQPSSTGGSSPTQGFNAQTNTSIFQASNYGVYTAPQVLDQIPPFDITLVGISEATSLATRMIIHSVQFSADQGGTSVDDLTLEKSVSFIAQYISPWTPLDELANGTGAGRLGSPKVYY